jgi:hypothetical protein
MLYKAYVCVTDNAANYFHLFPCWIFFESLGTLRPNYEIRYVFEVVEYDVHINVKIYLRNIRLMGKSGSDFCGSG